MKRSKLSLLQKGLLVLAFPLVYQAILLGVLIHRQRDHGKAVEMAVHTKNVLLELDQLVIMLLQAQANTRGYLLTKDPQYRQATLTTIEQLAPQEARLEQMVTDAPVQRQQLKRINELTRARVVWNHSILDLSEKDWDAAIARIADGPGRHLMVEIQKAIATVRAEEEAVDQARSEGLRSSAIYQNALLTAGLILNVLIGAVVIWIFSRRVSGRVAILNENMQRMSRGEPLEPQVDGDDEIAELDRGFHAMATEIEDAHEKERMYQQTLEKRNTELTRANRDLDHKNQENEMFVYSVSHDLRSPLVTLQGLSQERGVVSKDLLEVLEQPVIGDDARQRAHMLVKRDVAESILYIQTAVTRLSAIIDALLRLSRAGRIEYSPEVVDVTATLNRIVAAMKGTLTERGATVTVHNVPPTWGDATALEQIFANLASNAVNYLEPSRPGQIEFGALDRPPPSLENVTVYYLKDNGVGIPEAYQAKIFAVFQRLHPRMATGEGIGLPLVRRMVERHGGKIWVESSENEGATFFVALPLREHSPLTIAPRKESVRLFSRPA